MTGPDLTRHVIAAAAVLLVAYDLAAVRLWGEPATLSRVLTDWSREWPVIAFALGVVVGHVFWGR
jgi:hypothetical protein